MADPQPPISKLIQWRLECIVHTLVEAIAGLLPGSWVFHLGEAVAGLLWHLTPARRLHVLRNLRIAYHGKLTPTEIEALAKASFKRCGANLISVAHTSRLTPTQLADAVQLENPELITDKVAQGKGVVILLAHMGNWEALARMIHMMPPGTRAGAFYRPLNNPMLDRRVLKRRQADGTRMFSKHDPFHQACAFLREGGVVGILADQRVGIQGEITPFFGRVTRASPLPSLLARRTKSEVVALSMTTTAPGKWKITLHPVATPPTTGHCIEALEQAMDASPVDVFWLQERWRCYLRKKRGFSKWAGEKTPRSSKPHRIVLWAANAPADWALPDDWQHPDIDYEVVTAATPPAGIPAPVTTHPVPADTTAKGLESWLRALDRSQPLPVDVVAAINPPRSLRDACKPLSITFVSLG